MEFSWIGASLFAGFGSRIAASRHPPTPGYHRYLSMLCRSCDYTCVSLVCSLEQAKGRKIYPVACVSPSQSRKRTANGVRRGGPKEWTRNTRLKWNQQNNQRRQRSQVNDSQSETREEDKASADWHAEIGRTRTPTTARILKERS